jgi:hypothetical protein
MNEVNSELELKRNDNEMKSTWEDITRDKCQREANYTKEEKNHERYENEVY